MEKLANKLYLQKSNCILTFLFFNLLFTSASVLEAQSTANPVVQDTIPTQQNISYERGREYILGGILVVGLKKFSEETVKVFTGLKVGAT